tara:strand:+ start:418 stop:708 length:291 start_codon:yes stop_codon:yes gene_type:complete
MTDILKEAEKIFMQRHKQYGDFVPRFRKTALLYSALLGIKVVGSTLCKLIILEKISRSDHTYLKDNWLDIINYSLMGEILQKLEDTEKNEKVKPIK